MTPVVSRPAVVRPRDRVIMIRDHIHELLSADSSSPLNSTRARGLHTAIAVCTWPGSLIQYGHRYWESTVHLDEGTFEVEGGEQRIFDPLPNPLEAVQLCQVLKKLPRLVSIRIQMVVLRSVKFQVVLEMSLALCPHSCASTSLVHDVENL